MSEQASRCLRDFVEAVDSGEVDPCTANSLGCFAVKRNEIVEFNGEQVETLECGMEACSAVATLKHGPVEPGMQLSTCLAENDWRCQKIKEVVEVLPCQTDDKSCLPTATAYLLSKFGSTLSPEDIDVWLQRKPNEYPSYEGQIALDLAILKAGYAIKCVYPKTKPDIKDYYREGSELTYEDYIEATKSRSSEDYLGTLYTKEMFVKDMAYMLEVSKKFTKYEESGQLIYDYSDITPEDIAEELRTSAIRGTINISDGENHESHAVVVENIKTVRGGWVVAQYFNSYSDGPSRIVTERARDLGHLLRLERGLALIKPFVPEESA